jgi:glycosyltransferase involved in cell wall biosynthesis
MNNKNGTFIILSPGFPAGEDDTNCLPFIQLFVKRLKELNPCLEIVVLAFQYPYSKVPYQWHGVSVYPFRGRNKGGIHRLFVWRAVSSQLKQIIKTNPVAGMLSFWLGECALLGKHFARKYHIKHYTWLQGQDARPQNKYVRFIRPKGKELIALSDFLADEMVKNFKLQPGHIIPVGIDHRQFNATSGERTIDILGAGSLIPLKQYDIFIEMVAGLVKKFPTLRCIICGDGAQRERLEKLINENNLRQHIEMCGEIPHARLLCKMQAARIFLHPSSFEGFGMVCAEALSAGSHVVAFYQPMQLQFEHYHKASGKKEMTDILTGLLEDKNLDHSPVIPYHIEEICHRVLSLYDPERANSKQMA